MSGSEPSTAIRSPSAVRALRYLAISTDSGNGLRPKSSRVTRSGGASHRITRSAKRKATSGTTVSRSEEHTSELQSRLHLVCRLLLEKKKKKNTRYLSRIQMF